MLASLSQLPSNVEQYILITANYWAFTLTDGALRMLIVLHFHALGYSPLNIAFLFLFYECFGVVTNIFGGWIGARVGLNRTMNMGLLLQIVALSLLLVPTELLTIPLVMGAQALSGIAKDLNKMSAKSSIKLLIDDNAQHTLYRWVAILTGSKNALKGVGFFLGGLLLMLLEFRGAILVMAASLFLVWCASLVFLHEELGKMTYKPKFREMFSKNRNVNILSAARLFLFASRDVWFVVALPIYLADTFTLDHCQVCGFLALWIIGYGVVQGIAPSFVRVTPTTNIAVVTSFWAGALVVVSGLLAFTLSTAIPAQITLLIGLIIFGVVFAINSALHSYLIVSFAKRDGVSLDVGFYYMANAKGRLAGTLLSGLIFQQYGFTACLWSAALLVFMSAICALFLKKPASA